MVYMCIDTKLHEHCQARAGSKSEMMVLFLASWLLDALVGQQPSLGSHFPPGLAVRTHHFKSQAPFQMLGGFIHPPGGCVALKADDLGHPASTQTVGVGVVSGRWECPWRPVVRQNIVRSKPYPRGIGVLVEQDPGDVVDVVGECLLVLHQHLEPVINITRYASWNTPINADLAISEGEKNPFWHFPTKCVGGSRVVQPQSKSCWSLMFSLIFT